MWRYYFAYFIILSTCYCVCVCVCVWHPHVILSWLQICSWSIWHFLEKTNKLVFYNWSNSIFFHYSFTNHPFMKHDFQKFQTIQYYPKLSLHHCIIAIFFSFNRESNHGLTHLFPYKHGNDPSTTCLQNHVCSIKIISFWYMFLLVYLITFWCNYYSK